MQRHLPILDRAAAFARTIVAVRQSPVPRSAMLRSGGAISLGFLIFLAFDQIEAGVLCAVFTNLLCLCDRATNLGTRVWVQILGALLSVTAGAIGVLVAGHDALILVTTFAFALFAGFVHGTTPGVEAIPRYAIVCFVLSAFLPVAEIGTLLAVSLGTALAVTAVLIDHRVRNGRRGQFNKHVRAAVSYPGPRFSMVYGISAVFGLALGMLWEELRPYWVVVTTLLVMQPDRRANTVRVIQRFIGTLCGVALAFLIVQTLPVVAREKGLLLLVVTLPFVWPLGYERNYGLGTGILATWVLILIDIALPRAELATPIFLARLSDTSLGCAVALAGSFVVYETRDEAAAA